MGRAMSSGAGVSASQVWYCMMSVGCRMLDADDMQRNTEV